MLYISVLYIHQDLLIRSPRKKMAWNNSRLFLIRDVLEHSLQILPTYLPWPLYLSLYDHQKCSLRRCQIKVLLCLKKCWQSDLNHLSRDLLYNNLCVFSFCGSLCFRKMKINQRSFDEISRLEDWNQGRLKMPDCVLLHVVCCAENCSWNCDFTNWNHSFTCSSNSVPSVRIGELYIQLFKSLWINLSTCC